MGGKPPTAEKLAEKTFLITMIGTVICVAVVAIFIL
jgi:hypothetical protein